MQGALHAGPPPICYTLVPTPLPTTCLQESAQLRDKLSQLQLEVAENKGMLSELNLEVQQKTDRLAEVELRLKDCLAEKAQEEERLSRRLRDSHETIASLRAQSPPIKVSLWRWWPRAMSLLSWLHPSLTPSPSCCPGPDM